MRKLLNSELTRLTTDGFKQADKTPLIIVLDNVRSQHNIGAVFRTSDAFLIEAICLCGITATPPNPEIHKSALGSENTVDWKYYPSTLEAVTELKENGYSIISVEQVEGATDLRHFRTKLNKKYAVVFGNEVKGVLQEVIDQSDAIIEISQFGSKHSLNVSVTAGIVIWEFYRHLMLEL